MKKLWYSTHDGLKAPLVMYFIAVILLGLGNTFTSNNEIISSLLSLCSYTGAVMKVFFPLFLTINVIGKKHVDSVPIVGGIVSYLLIQIMTIFFGNQNFPSYYYSVSPLANVLNIGITRNPFNMGLATSFIAIIIVVNIYRISRQRLNYGIMRFIDNDAWFLIVVTFISAGIGLVCTLLFPYYVNIMERAMNFMSDNASNPAVMFIYGIVERGHELVGLQDAFHRNFWFAGFGGNWMDAAGNSYVGDVNIWTAQLAQGALQPGIGKYITPYYIINLAFIPGLVVGLYTQYSNKLDRMKNIALMIVVIIVSIFSGTIIPVHYYLFIISPVLMFSSIVVSSSLSGIFSALKVCIGYNYTGTALFATPGTLLNLIEIFPRLGLTTIEMLILVGFFFLVIGFLLVWLYYGILALDFLEPKKKIQNRKEMIRAFGGIGNIRIVDCSPTSFSVTTYDNTKVNEQEVLNLGASKVKETYFKYIVEYGPGSVSMYRQIKKELKAYKNIKKYID